MTYTVNCSILLTELPLLERPAAAARLGAGDVDRLRGRDLTPVTATLDDGQQLSAPNEVFVGHASHHSARYKPRPQPAPLTRAPTFPKLFIKQNLNSTKRN